MSIVIAAAISVVTRIFNDNKHYHYCSRCYYNSDNNYIHDNDNDNYGDYLRQTFVVAVVIFINLIPKPSSNLCSQTM